MTYLVRKSASQPTKRYMHNFHRKFIWLFLFLFFIIISLFLTLFSYSNYWKYFVLLILNSCAVIVRNLHVFSHQKVSEVYYFSSIKTYPWRIMKVEIKKGANLANFISFSVISKNMQNIYYVILQLKSIISTQLWFKSTNFK